MAISKVVYGNRTLMDISTDSVSAETLLQNETAHDSKGNAIVGTLEAYTSEVELWKNPDDSASFSAQTIFDFMGDDYKAYKIVWRLHSDYVWPEYPEMIVTRDELLLMSSTATWIADKSSYEIPARVLLYGRSKNVNTSRAIDFTYTPSDGLSSPNWAIRAGQARQAGTDTNSNKTAIPVAIYGLN